MFSITPPPPPLRSLPCTVFSPYPSLRSKNRSIWRRNLIEKSLTSSVLVVDVFYVPYMLKLSELYSKEIFEEREKLKNWWERVKERPSVRSLVANGIERHCLFDS